MQRLQGGEFATLFANLIGYNSDSPVRLSDEFLAQELPTSDANKISSRLATRFGYLTVIIAVLGITLIAASSYGLLISLRSPEVTGYRDFAGGETLSFDVAIDQLDKLTESNVPTVQLVTEATHVFHDGIAHVSRADIEDYGLEYYNMRVPFSENWILFALSYLKPDTYRDYEFCYYRRALERGTGRCGQQSMALISFLSEQGIDTGLIALDGHAVATARVNEKDWYILDSDYGGVIPFSIQVAEQNPDSVLPYYWSQAAFENGIHKLYAPKNEIKYGGPEVRYARACPIEFAAYMLKWAVPAALLIPLLSLIVFSAYARRDSSPDTQALGRT